MRYSTSIEDTMREELELPPLTPDERELRDQLSADLIGATAGQGAASEQGRQSEDGTQAPIQEPSQESVADPEAT